MPSAIATAFQDVLGPGRLRAQVGLAALTTFRTGGAAEWFLEMSEPDEVVAAMATAHQLGLPVTLLGGGSNVLVASRGVRGLVIRFRHGSISCPRPGCVRAGAGVSLNELVRWSVGRGYSGLERWAGTPGTVGGAIRGNAHFGGQLIGGQVITVGLATSRGQERTVPREAMQFGYDESRLQESGEAVLWVDFTVDDGDPDDLRAAARQSLAFRKRTQPLRYASAGCVFRNPSTDGAGGLVSAGSLIDRAGLKGLSAGGASVSTLHGNFIVSDGSATPVDIRRLIERCRSTVFQQFNIVLRDEIVYLGEF